MRRNLALAFSLCFVAATAFAQSRLNGKWETDRQKIDPQTTPYTQRQQNVRLEVTIEGAKAAGSLEIGGLGGSFYVFQDGKVTGNKVEFRDSQPYSPTWTIEMVDDNTIILTRGDLPLVGSNVLDLIAVLGTQAQPALPVQVAAANAPQVSVPRNPAVPQADGKVSISGNVWDKSQAMIPGVTVTVINLESGEKFTVLTNDVGRYGVSNLIPGKYTVTAFLPGFQTSTVSNLNIVDTQFVQDITLEVRGSTAAARPSPSTCEGNRIAWCATLHRGK